ncbi:MAG: hypothetical protein V7785_08350 [Bermanella sp.]
MPMYTVSTNKPLEIVKRQELARVIMNIHCGLTKAPQTFVNVIYSQNVSLKDGIAINVLGNVRKGRTPEMNARLTKDMHEAVANFLNIGQNLVELSLFEVSASWVMEGGNILPEPGEEDDCEWLQQQH